MKERPESRKQAIAWGAILAVAGVKLLAHLLTLRNYGIFIDELYYLACAEHLDFGYVDHPPGIALLTWLARTLGGDSLGALRIWPALFGVATVILAGLIARELGGGRWAQLVASLAVLVSPIYLFMNTILSMNALDGLLWTVAAWLLIRILERGERRDWLLLGVVLGLGLENKISVLFLGAGLAVGLLLTPNRRYLKEPGPWLAGTIAMGLFLPHLVWQALNGWPTREFMRNVTELKNRPMALTEFLATQALEIHPLNFLLLLLGLGFFFFAARGRWRPLGWLYLTVFVVLVTRNTKAYYLSPIYPLMLAGGAVALEGFLARSRHTWPRAAVVTVLALGGAATAPLTLPVLPVEALVRYFELFGGPPPSGERKEVGPLPQHFADMFGNEELVEVVAAVYDGLPEGERERAVIFGMAYPQAAAVDFFGPRRGLPKAISGHNSYWLWGPGEKSGEVMIVIGIEEATLREFFDQVELAAVARHRYAMPWRNNLPIWICRSPKAPLAEAWPRIKHYE